MIISSQPQHVIVRSTNRSEIFCCTTDYRLYLEKLQTACKKHDCRIHVELHRLGTEDRERRAGYRAPFNQAISEPQICGDAPPYTSLVFANISTKTNLTFLLR